jgi:transposase-like protein
MTDDEPTPAELPNYAVCPACGYTFGDETLDDATTEVLDEEDADGVGMGKIVTRFPCPDCGRDLRLVVESVAPDALGLDMTLEVDE